MSEDGAAKARAQHRKAKAIAGVLAAAGVDHDLARFFDEESQAVAVALTGRTKRVPSATTWSLVLSELKGA